MEGLLKPLGSYGSLRLKETTQLNGKTLAISSRNLFGIAAFQNNISCFQQTAPQVTIPANVGNFAPAKKTVDHEFNKYQQRKEIHVWSLEFWVLVSVNIVNKSSQ